MELLTTDDPEVAVEELRLAASDLIAELEEVVPSAIRGHERSTRAYVRAWKDLSSRFLKLAHDSVPDFVIQSEKGEFLLVDVKHSASPVGKTHLDYLAVNAPFSSWVGRFGPGRGVAIYLLAELREAIPSLPPIPIEKGENGLPHWSISREEFSRFVRYVLLELQQEQPLLERITSIFDLGLTELASLFGVRRQAVSQWFDEGIPPGRQPKALLIAQIADILERNLLPDRISAIARTSSAGYGDRSMLEMIADDRHEELLENIRRSFDWASTA